jgi:CxxC motif-containing protein (DUF1111 family)
MGRLLALASTTQEEGDMRRFVKRTDDTLGMNGARHRPTALRAVTWIVGVAFTLGLATTLLQSQKGDTRRERFTHKGGLEPEETAAAAAGRKLQEAPTGFDNETNGFDPQGPPFDAIDEDTVAPLASFNDNRFIFEESETIEDGLGPTYNAQGCKECHQNVVTGGASQIAEHRTGRLFEGEFFESLGGSLIHSRATHPDIMELVAFEDDIRTFRISTNTLGNGFVEAIANRTLLAIRDAQPEQLRGTAIQVPVLENNGRTRFGRFGWKNQHASLESFSADAYLNEMGITTPLMPTENTSSGRSVEKYDLVEDPEDDGVDVKAFANFMRSTKAPPRGPIDEQVTAGEKVFMQVGCGICHTPSIPTARPGTVAGTLVIPEALGNKIIHPFSDFLLHDIGTGDGIPVLPGEEYAGTATQMRTAPLWALRTRNRLMHDGLSFTKQEAIERHAGQAAPVTERYKALDERQRAALLRFLDSL